MGRAPRTQDEFSRRVIEELFAAMPEGVSIREIGRRAEMSHSQLSRIKNGERVLDVDQLEVLSRVAKVAPHVIVERAERRESGQVLNFPGTSALSPATSTVRENEESERAAMSYDPSEELEGHEEQP